MEIGAQFFTIRDYCKNLTDFAESIKKVADIGYKYVQISGTCAYEPQWLKEQLDKNGLQCVLTHNPTDRLINSPAEVSRDHDIFGCKYVGLGYFGFNQTKPDCTLETFTKTYLPVAKALKENGKYFMYHNHDKEFQKIDGRIVLEHLKDIFAADEMGFTLDTYWVQVGGGDPAQWLEKLAGRVPCIHLKDCGYDKQMAVVGEGNINFDRVFQMAEKAGTKYMLVEQDSCNGENPFDCLKRSYQNLKAFGF